MVPRIPRDKGLDSTLALLSDGYTFLPERFRRYESDIFETRLMLRKAVCMMGEEASRVFYEPGRFTRQGAMPPNALQLLQDKGSVALLDGEAHRWRKQMFLSLMTPEGVRRLANVMADQWRTRLETWEGTDEVVLFYEIREILCRAVSMWVGVPLAESEAKQRTREFGAMIDGAGAFGPRSWCGMLLRARTDRWIRDVVQKDRTHELQVPEGSAEHVID